MSTLDSTVPLGTQISKPSKEHKPATRTGFWRRGVVWATLAVTLAGIATTGFVVSREPKLFDPMQAATDRAPAELDSLPAGSVLTAAVMEIGDTLLSKPGGFIGNDVAPPFSLLDNMQ